MKKKYRYIIIILIIFVLSLIIRSALNKSDVDYESEVSYLLRDITISDADGDEAVKIKFTRNRDEDYALESSAVYKNDVECSSQEYAIDKDGHVVSIKSNGDYSFACNLAYQENLLKMEIILNEDEKYIVECEYDENGWRKQVNIYNTEKELLKYYVCSFDAESREEEVSEYDKNNTLQYYYENICTEDNQPVKVIKYKANGELESTFIFEYETHRDSEVHITHTD